VPAYRLSLSTARCLLAGVSIQAGDDVPTAAMVMFIGGMDGTHEQ
jgi:hypothetical protein